MSSANLNKLQTLEANDYLEAEDASGKIVSLALFEPSKEKVRLHVTLKPQHLAYYEDVNDLISFSPEEPEEYYVQGFGDLRKDRDALEPIRHYRAMLDAKAFLRKTAELDEAGKVTFFVPEKLELPFLCVATDLRELPEILRLRSELAVGAVERDQRIAFFKGSLRDYLRTHPVELRFSLFLRNLNGIYDSYRRDYELWIGNTIADIKKSFEEKRLKFVSDLNGVLAAIQASLLAVPLGAVLVCDKFDIGNPLKNGLLTGAIAAVSAVALKLLANQQHTLDSTKAAIDAVKADYEERQPAGNREFPTRLQSVYHQETKVRKLLYWFRFGIAIIFELILAMWFASYCLYSWPREHVSSIVLGFLWIGSAVWLFRSFRPAAS